LCPKITLARSQREVKLWPFSPSGEPTEWEVKLSERKWRRTEWEIELLTSG
jgi:hypothetical protein